MEGTHTLTLFLSDSRSKGIEISHLTSKDGTLLFKNDVSTLCTFEPIAVDGGTKLYVTATSN